FLGVFLGNVVGVPHQMGMAIDDLATLGIWHGSPSPQLVVTVATSLGGQRSQWSYMRHRTVPASFTSGLSNGGVAVTFNDAIVTFFFFKRILFQDSTPGDRDHAAEPIRQVKFTSSGQ
ncbi:MAG: hypothetical protein AB7V46_19050, partial [Thermomicrobiales bacterium]